MDEFTILVVGGFLGLLIGMMLLRPRSADIVVVQNDPETFERRSVGGCFVPFVLLLLFVTVLLVAMG
jgi:hypothetical protein